jgi:D-glycero-alpha-D-manno-heptose 1-phosphate guanylyltransferase
MFRANPKNIDVLILCGGLGTRIRSVISDRPKSLAPIGGKPFLDILLNELHEYGFQRIVFCIGYMKEKIIEHIDITEKNDYSFSEEDIPLGTGGAVKNAKKHLKSDTLLIVNGDSYCKVDYNHLLKFHQRKAALMTMVLSQSNDTQGYGEVLIDDECGICSFHEKVDVQQSNLINAGIYVLNKKGLSLMSSKYPFSLEYDYFPEIITNNKCFGYVVKSKVIDIGTPERYQIANELFENS